MEFQTHHLKFISNTHFCDRFFGTKTEKQSRKLKSRLSIDVAERCHAEHVQAYKRFSGKHQTVVKAMQKTKGGIVFCYQGDRTLCKRYSFVCKGGKTKNWIHRSAYFQNDFKLFCTKLYTAEFQQCIEYRLSDKMLSKTKLLLNTQKAEAFNRAVISKVPKSVTFTSNRKARVHCVCKTENRGTDRAITEQCKACDVPIIKVSRVA